MQTLVDPQMNPLATVHRVRIVPGGEIVPHIHDKSAETFLITSGRALCTMGDSTMELRAGNLGYAPAGNRHGLKNIGDEDVHLVTVFTPPV
jgi:mannose-6-phosphate isomerase-like protein (cupin superfamily)